MEFIESPSTSPVGVRRGAAGVKPRRPPALGLATLRSMDNMGIGYDDHHHTDRSPPPAYKSLYTYLPRSEEKEDLVPPKICMVAEINALKNPLGLGVYELVKREHVADREDPANSKPMPLWKHTGEDLCISHCIIDGEAFWVVARYTTLGSSSGQQLCMKLPAKQAGAKGKMSLPFLRATDGHWHTWTKHKWVVEPSVRCRPTYHGWGTYSRGSTARGDARLREITRPQGFDVSAAAAAAAAAATASSPQSVIPKSASSSPYGQRQQNSF